MGQQHDRTPTPTATAPAASRTPLQTPRARPRRRGGTRCGTPPRCTGPSPAPAGAASQSWPGTAPPAAPRRQRSASGPAVLASDPVHPWHGSARRQHTCAGRQQGSEGNHWTTGSGMGGDPARQKRHIHVLPVARAGGGGKGRCEGMDAHAERRTHGAASCRPVTDSTLRVDASSRPSSGSASASRGCSACGRTRCQRSRASTAEAADGRWERPRVSPAVRAASSTGGVDSCTGSASRNLTQATSSSSCGGGGGGVAEGGRQGRGGGGGGRRATCQGCATNARCEGAGAGARLPGAPQGGARAGRAAQRPATRAGGSAPLPPPHTHKSHTHWPLCAAATDKGGTRVATAAHGARATSRLALYCRMRAATSVANRASSRKLYTRFTSMAGSEVATEAASSAAAASSSATGTSAAASAPAASSSAAACGHTHASPPTISVTVGASCCAV